MDRIKDATATADHKFQEASGSIPATRLRSLWLNGMQEEIASFIENEGITLSSADLTQLRQALDLRFPRWRDAVIKKDTIEEVTALTGITDGQQFSVAEGAGAGTWRYTTDDISAEVAADPRGGIVRPVDGGDGATGGFVRQYGQSVSVTPSLKSWWFGVEGNGTDESSVVADIMAFAATKKAKVEFPSGTFIAQFGIPDGVTVEGAGFSGYANNVTNGATVFRRPSAANYCIDMSSQSPKLKYCDIDGNGGRAAGKDGIRCVDGDYGHLHQVKVLDCRYGFAGDGGSPAGVFEFTGSVFRQCDQGLRNFRDSLVMACTFSANYVRGIYCNQGQNRIIGGFIEWNRDQDNLTDGIPNSAEGIYLDSNAMEIQIYGIAFDRNAGSDIFINNGAERISIGDNQHKGSGWGGNLTNQQRVAIRVNGGCDVLEISSGTVETRNHGPSSIKSWYCPLAFADLGSSTRVTLGTINDADVGNPLDLNSKDLTWVESASVAGEYRLALGSETASVSPVISPDYVSDGYSQLAVGTLGSLSDGEWAWGDNDSLGYNTVYIKLASGDPLGESVSAFYNIDVVDISGVSDIKTTAFRDRSAARIAASATESFVLKTRERLTASNSRKPLKLYISADQQTTGEEVFSELPLLLDRSSSAETSVVEGNIVVLKDGGTTLTVGWATAATDDLLVTVDAALMGEEITVSVENTDGARFADVDVYLGW